MLDLNVVQAIYEMTKGATLLKGGRSKRTKGKGHYRNFSLSKDLTYLQWDSPKKEKEESIIYIAQMGDLKHGFKSSSSHLLQEQESLSFSVIYFDQPLQGKTLDFVCKDKQQYQIWTTGLEALINGFHDKEAVWELMKKNKELKGSHNDDKTKGSDSGSSGSLKSSPQEDKTEACQLFTWGDGTKGVLGHGEDNEEHTPHIVHSLLGWGIKMVACGTAHTLALSVDGVVFSWGSGKGGRLGQGHLRDRYTPIKIEGLLDKHVVEVACNEFHSAAVSSNGELFTWGKDGFRLGYQCLERRQTSPGFVEGLKNSVAHVACGLNHTIGCTFDGELFVFGDNEFGQLGLGDKATQLTPVFPQVYELETVSILNVACGKYHSAATTDFGTCWLWGRNDCGQLGTGDTSDRLLPTKISLPIAEREHSDTSSTTCSSFWIRSRDAFVTAISCGEKHSAVITRKGIVFSFGDNSFGQLGIRKQSETETFFCSPVPVFVPAEERVVSLSCGGFHTALVTENGKLYTMGKGTGGRLGNGEDITKVFPNDVESLAGKFVLSVSCGAKHTACAVAPSSLKDEEYCMSCRQKVGGFRKKHQCKNCYGMFCTDCCSKKLMPCKGHKDSVRVCNKCYILMTTVNVVRV